MSYNTRSSTQMSWRQREALKAEQQRTALHRKQTEKTEQNFPTLVTTAHRIRNNAPRGFAEKAEMWRVQEELEKQMEAYRKARTARERRAIMNTVFVFQRRAATSDDYEEEYEEEWRDMTLDEIYPPHGRRGTYGPVHSDSEFGKLAAEHAPSNRDGTRPTADDFSDGWRLVTRLPFRPPHGELTDVQLHELYLERGNHEDEDEQDVNGDLTDRNQRREFY